MRDFMDRRTFAKISCGALVASISGCTNGASQDPTTPQQTTCRTVDREFTNTVYDDLDSWDAGSSPTWDFELDRGDAIYVRAVRVNEARPALEVKDPAGELILDVGPSENIERRVTADEAGTYYVTLRNEAFLTTGQWDVTIEVTTVRQERVCS